jgi:hypothetical protein
MTESLFAARPWPLPFLIEAASPLYCPHVLPKASAFEKQITVQSQAVGEVGIGLGGPLWAEPYEMHDALAGIIHLPLEAWLRHGEDDDGERFPLPDLFRHNEALIVSPRFMEVARPFLRDFEVLPFRFESTMPNEDIMVIGGGETIDGYGWLRTWRRLDVIDRSRSEFRPMLQLMPDSPYYGSPVSIHDWSNLVLFPIPANEHFFGLAGLSGGYRFFSLEFYRAINQAGLEVRFKPVSLNVADREEHWEQARTLRARLES